VTFTAGNFSPDSTFVVAVTPGSSNPPIADNVQSYTGTITAKDPQGNLLSNLDPTKFSFSILSNGSTTGYVTATQPVAGATAGTYTMLFTSTRSDPS
jgi:hypothetical protein